MEKLTLVELKKQCKLWGIPCPSDEDIAIAKKYKTSVAIQILGVYFPETEELHPWRITPSSEDKGYSD